MSETSGSLYLGSLLDAQTRKPSGGRLEIPRHEFTTHGVIVGMTGSGKTGLGIVLLEEALRSGVPALILDPKGDMGNLALTFPTLAPAEFAPWLDAGEAAREGISLEEMAERTARRWREGLAASGLGPDDLRRFRDAVDVRLVTPGSRSGTPLNVLGNLAAPAGDWEEQAETLREEIESLVSGVLVLAGVQADPLTSREHILLSNLVEHAWRSGRDMDLASLIGQIQEPPVRRLGVFELDAFFPPRDRSALAMRLNGLAASPSFADWMIGDPVDVDALLRAPDGRPRASVVYLAHLSEIERQFVVTLLLSRVVTWMRRQPGTSDLRALVYIDEIFGMAPPTGEPPSKRPMLTLFKQARAHGVGLVVATQNPVDLDYKAMSNAGTWMIGRLQTERDKARIVEALRSATGELDVGSWDARIGELGKREFVLRSAGSATPTLFTSRWAMSFLRGPLTRAELLRLRDGATGTTGAAQRPMAPPEPAAAATPSAGEDLAPNETPVMPPVAAGIPVRYLDPSAPWAEELGIRTDTARVQAGLAMRVRLLFDDDKADLRHEEEWEAVLFPLERDPRADAARMVDYDDRDFRLGAPDGVVYVLPDAPVDRSEFFRRLKSELQDHLYRSRRLRLHRNAALRLFSRPGESQEEFTRRCLAAAEDRADGDAATLRSRYEKKLQAARDRAAQAERRVRELQVDVGQRRQQELVAGAGELLSLFLGGRRRIRSLSGVASRRSQTVRTKERLQSAGEKLEDHEEAIRKLEEELAEEVEALWDRWRSAAQEIEPVDVPLEKTDVRVEEPVLFWG